MNLFYEDFPMWVDVNGEKIPIVTDFREYIRLMDMLNDNNLTSHEKTYYLRQYFLKEPDDFQAAIEKLILFVLMESEDEQQEDEEKDQDETHKKEVYSFEYDYPFIFSAFLSEYGINLRSVPYLHWWEFRSLFDGLSENTEIKKRIMYRSIDLNDIKDNDEKKRIQKIQRSIALPSCRLTDYDIGDMFGW